MYRVPLAELQLEMEANQVMQEDIAEELEQAKAQRAYLQLSINCAEADRSLVGRKKLMKKLVKN